MDRKTFFLLAAIMAMFCHDGHAQTKLSLTQLPGCAITSTTPTNTPILLAIVPTSTGTSQFACYTFSGASITAATSTSPATISLPSVVIPSFINGETPGGTIDGSNTKFTLAFAPLVGSLDLYRNGLLLELNVDYSLSGNAITFLAGAIPQPAGAGSSGASPDSLQASYRH